MFYLFFLNFRLLFIYGSKFDYKINSEQSFTSIKEFDSYIYVEVGELLYYKN